MIYTYLTTLETSWPEVIWKVIDPNNETPDFSDDAVPENACFVLDELIYPDCFEALKGTLPSKSDLETEMNRLNTEFDGQEYARNREAEFPSIKDLVVALYDTDDRAAIDTKRAAVKAKFPKP